MSTDKKIGRRTFLATTAAAVAAGYPMKANMARAARRKVSPNEIVNVGLIGLGRRCMGVAQSSFDIPHMRIVAVCDIFEPLVDQCIANEGKGRNWKGYTDLCEMIEKENLDGVMVETTTHARAWVTCHAMAMGMDVYIEKPMCLTYREAERMIQAARDNDRVLTVFHNRRWDGDYMAIKKAIADGLIGEVFHIEAYMGGWSKPRDWWRSDKQISGGAFYDWGAHYLDWTLGLIPEARMTHISGFFHQDVAWQKFSNEDQVQAIVRVQIAADQAGDSLCHRDALLVKARYGNDCVYVNIFGLQAGFCLPGLEMFLLDQQLYLRLSVVHHSDIIAAVTVEVSYLQAPDAPVQLDNLHFAKAVVGRKVRRLTMTKPTAEQNQ